METEMWNKLSAYLDDKKQFVDVVAKCPLLLDLSLAFVSNSSGLELLYTQ